MKPTAKKVLEIMQFPSNITPSQANVQGYLRKYVKSLNISNPLHFSEFTFRAYEGDNNWLYLTEVNRRIKSGRLSEGFVTKIIPGYWYRKTAKHL